MVDNEQYDIWKKQDAQELNINDFKHGHGHFFIKKSFHKPTYCHHCTEMLWGLIGQGYICEVCNFVVHDRCLKTVVSPCSTIATSLIKNPVAHCWSEPGHFKRKFCNVCRKRLDDSWAIRCEICEYYAHLECQDFVVSDCKDCALYTSNGFKCQIQYHHWREGNLPSNSKCSICKKTCWSSECLSGMRCDWCGINAHATCYKKLPKICDFGLFKPIMLPPQSISIPRVDLPREIILGINSKFVPINRQIIEEQSSSSSEYKTSKEENESSSTGKKDKEKDEDNYIAVRVYDGNVSYKRQHNYKNIIVHKGESVEEIIASSLRTFHVSDNPKNYYASLITNQSSCSLVKNDMFNDDILRDPDHFSQLKLNSTLSKYGVSLSGSNNKPSIILRSRLKDETNGYLPVYPGLLRIDLREPKNIPVSCNTTVYQIIQEALPTFGLQGENSRDYRLVEMILEKEVVQRVMSDDEKPWNIMQNISKESLYKMRMTRFYLQEKEDPHGKTISLFIGNLPPSLSQRQYETILANLLEKSLKYNNIGPFYYEYGCLVITYDSPDISVKAFKTLKSATYDDKSLIVLLLPNIHPSNIPSNVAPLLVFVNVKSGGCQGLGLISSFRKLLNPHQVFDLENDGPLPGLYVFRNVARYKILICGGDGTVGWVLSCLDNVGQDSKCENPPCAVIPLGTGNDLARVLNWGPGYTGGEDAHSLLRDVIEAEEVRLDRWTLVFHPDDKYTDDSKYINCLNNTQNTEDNTQIYIMNNYCGIGLDADISLDFHMARTENPSKFSSRLHNKSVYLKMGLRKMMKKKISRDLQRDIKLEVDGKEIDIPAVEGLVILNILSWGSGANLWGAEREDQFQKPTHYDGMLEIVGVSGVVHMGQIQSGLRSGIRIAQGGHIRITIINEIPIQVDGEPWLQQPGQCVVLKSALKAAMLRKVKHHKSSYPTMTQPQLAITFNNPKMKRCNTDPPATTLSSPSSPPHLLRNIDNTRELIPSDQNNDNNDQNDVIPYVSTV
ncbi:unnamed protein product [Gordionus sp. m RMFG-2023]|uniref:diacylglycerol kinase theta-like n=1 Tax=Gordionus sp. m RMFG-2023 TaxID=3053472 RepID=UPI0030E030DD